MLDNEWSPPSNIFAYNNNFIENGAENRPTNTGIYFASGAGIIEAKNNILSNNRPNDQTTYQQNQIYVPWITTVISLEHNLYWKSDYTPTVKWGGGDGGYAEYFKPILEMQSLFQEDDSPKGNVSAMRNTLKSMTSDEEFENVAEIYGLRDDIENRR